MRQRVESAEKIRNMFQLHIALYLSRICEESGILPSKLTSLPITASWMLAEGIKLLGQRQRTLLFMTQQHEYHIVSVPPVPSLPYILQWQPGGGYVNILPTMSLHHL